MSSSPLGSSVLGIPFSFNPDLFPSDFPSHLNLKASEDFSSQPYEDSFKLAQEAHAPYYSVAVVYCSDENGKGEYKIYDAIRFNAIRKEIESDPFTNKTIESIYFFALTCFEIDEKDICQPVELTDGHRRFIPIEVPPEEMRNGLDLMLVDSINFFTLSKEPDMIDPTVEKIEARRKEYIIANLINERKIFPDLNPQERRNEVIKWLWCAAHESLAYRPLLQLVRLYDPNNSTHAKIIKHLFSTIKPAPKGKIMHAESRAYLDLQELRAKLSKKLK